jgi:hypothetical protein
MQENMTQLQKKKVIETSKINVRKSQLLELLAMCRAGESEERLETTWKKGSHSSVRPSDPKFISTMLVDANVVSETEKCDGYCRSSLVALRDLLPIAPWVNPFVILRGQIPRVLYMKRLLIQAISLLLFPVYSSQDTVFAGSADKQAAVDALVSETKLRRCGGRRED